MPVTTGSMRLASTAPVHWLNKVPWWLWTLLGFILLSSIYEYGRVLHMRPLPHHLWRQTTCLSMAREYALNEWNLFRPGVQSFIAKDAETGRSAGEFPLLYYIVGMLWRVVGQHESVYRGLMVLLHAVGTLALFATGKRLLRDGAMAALVALFFFTVPTVVYFTLAFLPDVPALDLVLVGAWATLRYWNKGDRRWLLVSIVALSLAGLLKITALMLPLALAITLLVLKLFPGSRKDVAFEPKRASALLLGLAAVFLVQGAWVYYAFAYNNWNSASYSFMGTWAYWEIDAEQRSRALDFGREILAFQFFDRPLWWLFAGMLAHVLWNVRRIPPAVLLFNGLLLFGTLLFGLLWTVALDNHDYYFIAPLVLPMAITITFLRTLMDHRPARLSPTALQLAVLAVVAYHAVYAMNNHRMRTYGRGDLDRASLIPVHHDAELRHWELTRYWDMDGLLDIAPLARAAGVGPTERIITVPDASVCSALYLAAQPGYNEYGGVLMDSATVADRVSRGATYLYVLGNDPEVIGRLNGWMDRPVLEHQAVRIYDLRRSP